jgi:hypothetical protein
MSKVFVGIAFLLFMASCYRSAPDPDFDMSLVIPADSMAVLLSDLHIADGIVTSKRDAKIPLKKVSTEYFNEVLKRHNLEKKAFDESMHYYSFHTEELKQIYEQVLIILSKKESMVMPVKDAAKPGS